MVDHEKKGEEFLAEARSKAEGARGLFGSFTAKLFGNSSQLEDAAELYIRAANCFKMAKKWEAAGNAFLSSAKIQLKQGSKHTSAANYVDAANCYRKCSSNEAVASLLNAIEIYTDMGRFHVAAKHHQTVAEIFESDLLDNVKASLHYERAADYFKGEASTSAANRCILKVAQFAAHDENYEKAIGIYEEVALASCESSLLKYAAKGYFFNAALCQMCVETANAAIALDKYKNLFPAFSDSREYKLIMSLLEAMETDDVDAFTQAVADYDSISRLDPWTTSMLLRVKKTLEGDASDLR